jgi:hypothetical protein
MRLAELFEVHPRRDEKADTDADGAAAKLRCAPCQTLPCSRQPCLGGQKGVLGWQTGDPLGESHR